MKLKEQIKNSNKREDQPSKQNNKHLQANGKISKTANRE